ncbi:hypothetical protein ABPG74_012192 [Tetrahymena malaccensis]
MYQLPSTQPTNIPPGVLPQGQNPMMQQTIIKRVYYIQQPIQNLPAQQQFYAQPTNPQIQILAQPSLNYNQSSVPSNVPLMQQQISLPTEPATLTHMNTIQNLNQQQKTLEFNNESFSYLNSKVQESIEPFEVSKWYIFLFAFRLLLQVFFWLYIIVSLGFYSRRPEYYSEKVGNNYYFKAKSSPVSHTNYPCTAAQNEDAIILINQYDTYVFICAILMLLFKSIYIYKQSQTLLRIYKQGFISSSQKFDTSILDYLNFVCDYSFIIPLSPITAVVYEECANLRFGIYLFGAGNIYRAGLFYSLFNFALIVFLIEFCKGSSYDRFMLYPYLILIILPGAFLVCLKQCGIKILSQEVTYYKVTTTYTDGTKDVEYTNDDVRCLVIIPIILFIIAVLFIACMIIVSFALILVYCHPAVIVYYVLTTLISGFFLWKNKGGANYRLQLVGMYSLNLIRTQYPQKFKEYFSQDKFNEENFKKNKDFQNLQNQPMSFYQDPQRILQQNNQRNTCKIIEQYQEYYEGVILEAQKKQINKN